MSASADEFISILRDHLSPLVHVERTVNADFKSSHGFSSRPGQSSVAIHFYNLPTPRVQERRGGGAESQNNRMMFWIHGFEADSSMSVAKVKAELSVNNIGHQNNWAPQMRAKSGPPEKIALYVASFINEIAETFEPNYTHE